MKKILNLILSLLIISTLIPTQVHAGVVKELEEVDEAQRIHDEQERIRQQEEYRKEVAEQQAKAAQVEPKREVIPEAPKPQPVVQKTTTKEEITEVVSTREETEHTCIICRTAGAILGGSVSSVVGLVRGSAAKGNDLAESYSDGLGGGILGTVVGVPTGAITGGVTGALTGLLDGTVSGVSEGWNDPFTKESFLQDGNDFLDYDPYDIGAD